MDKNLFIGREYEIRQLEKYRNSKESEFVIVAVQEAAHVQPRKHLQRHFQVAPPGEIISLPDAAVPVGADE